MADLAPLRGRNASERRKDPETWIRKFTHSKTGENCYLIEIEWRKIQIGPVRMVTAARMDEEDRDNTGSPGGGAARDN